MTDLQRTLQEMIAAISDEARIAGRKSEEIRLMAVSKTQPYQAIEELYSYGQLLFGENRVQEAEQKFPSLRKEDMQLHLIGHLQSNKLKKAISLFDSIDSVDSLKLAQKIEELVERPFPVLLELKTAPEDSKSGFENEDELFRALDTIADFPKLQVKGLMTIGPLDGDEKAVRSAFSRLRETAEQVRLHFPHLGCNILSMGMSSDWKWAIEEGSTMIRIGTRLFGSRRVQ